VVDDDPLDGVGIELAELSLDEPESEATMFFDDRNGREKTDIIRFFS
ncbi:HAT family dimerization domain containing protein, partial [Trifolium medium]|nr:HAT family dimerization domain containing protein [Trifolium medium]